jgi:ADP-ribosyl-[dinitrogen reductase] hydrolase
MLGAIVGDVVGSPYEFHNVKWTDFRLFDRGAQCTDDSVLTVATADALLNGRGYREAYQEYFHRFPNAGYGGSFAAWANRRQTAAYGSWGNGSAMRCSPVGWAVLEIYLSPDLADLSLNFCKQFGVPLHSTSQTT